jgi:hypothetical protein
LSIWWLLVAAAVVMVTEALVVQVVLGRVLVFQ